MQTIVRVDLIRIDHDNMVYRVYYKSGARRHKKRGSKGRAWWFTAFDRDTNIVKKFRFYATLYNEFHRVPEANRHLIAEAFADQLKPHRVWVTGE